MSELPFTVIGYWDDSDNPVAVGVIDGFHDVTGGDDGEYQPWATSVYAIDSATAEAMACDEMRETLEDDSPEEDDDPDPDQP